MMAILSLVGAVFLISWIMSNPTERAAARQRLKPFSRGMWIATGSVWLVIGLLEVVGR